MDAVDDPHVWIYQVADQLTMMSLIANIWRRMLALGQLPAALRPSPTTLNQPESPRSATCGGRYSFQMGCLPSSRHFAQILAVYWEAIP
jgi:hypothetical protein